MIFYIIIYIFIIQEKNADFKQGLILMAGINEKTINVNSSGSYGIITVKTKDSDENVVDNTGLEKYNTNYGTTIGKSSGTDPIIGGLIGSHATKENESKIENKNTINLNGDKAIGIGLLHSIQGVYNTGTINIGKTDPSSLSYNNELGNESKVQEAVGVYSEVYTRPVLNGGADDYGQINNSGIWLELREYNLEEMSI